MLWFELSMQLLERRLSELSKLESHVYGVFEGVQDTHVQIVAFSGEYRVGSAGNPDAAYMRAVVTSAAAAWDSVGVVFDLRDLDYSWGNALVSVVQAGELLHDGDDEHPFPVRLVVSSKCRAGLESLFAAMGDGEGAWMYETIDDAVESVREAAREYLDEPTGETVLPRT
jgi:hypothetical protein